MANSRVCLSCGLPLSDLQARTSKLCGNPVCASKHRNTPASQRCLICERILTAAQATRRLCASEECRRAWTLAQYQAGERQRHAELEARAAEWRERLAAEAPNVSSFPIALVPYNDVVPIVLSEQRREAFHAYLQNMIAEAMVPHSAAPREAVEDSASSKHEPDSALFHACAACRGRCCRNGEDHAYLTAQTIRRCSSAAPDRSADDLAALYLAHLPAEILEQGCVFQRADGCALPRSLRSDTCNDYYCPELRKFEQEHAAEESVRAFFVAADSGKIGRGVFVSTELVQLVCYRDSTVPG